MTTETPPLASPLPDDGRPTWQQVVDLFRKNGAGPPPTSLRDEIVALWSWARYGEALARRSIASAEPAGEVGWREAFDEMLAALKLALEVGLADEDGAGLVEDAIYAAISKAQALPASPAGGDK